jgi:predicted metal-dependent hydrolase
MIEPIINERERVRADVLQRAGAPIPEWWFKDNALLSFQFNSTSTTVPEGERFIVRAAQDAQQYIQDPVLQERSRTLVHEETAHARMHDAYNRYLTTQGFPSQKYDDENKRLSVFFEHWFSLKTRLAICAMIEHFTAIFSKQVLEICILEGEDVDERMDRIWSWHALEELDHRSTIFDIYLDMKGGYLRRVSAAMFASFLFAFVHTKCLLAFLNAKGLLWKWHVWRSGWPYLFGRRGVYRIFLTHWVLYFKPGFHPYSIPIENRLQKQLHHYHIEDELVGYFPREVVLEA